ncbi:autotransporter assembly complex protein TamA [Endothiovibrio diazotrophicus]
MGVLDIGRWTTALALLAAAAAVHGAGVVEIDGLEGAAKENALAALSLQREREAALTTARLHRLHRLANGEIRHALEPFGYYRAKVDGSLEESGEQWRARYRVTPGPAVPAERVDLRLEGPCAEDPPFQALRDRFPLQPGAPLDHRRYEEGKRRLLELADRRGYFDAKLTRHHIALDLDAYQARVALALQCGPRYRFGALRFDQEAFNDTLLARYASFAPGDPYDLDALLDLERALRDADYFDSVEVTPLRRQADADHRVPIRVRLEERKRSKFTFGLGYGTDTGPRLGVGWERRRLNRAGHRFQSDLRLSGVGNRLNASYLIPGEHPETERWTLAAGWETDNTDSRDSESLTLGAAWRHQRAGWGEELSLRYLDEDYTTASDSGESELVIPAVAWSRSWGDGGLEVRRGARLELELSGAAEGFLSDANFTKATAHGKLILPLDPFGGDAGRLLLRGDLGVIATDEFNALPASLRYYAGGDQSVRGYDYESLGPRDANGKVAGGRYLLVGSAEYEHRLSGPWSGALFIDAGNAFDSTDDPLMVGAGFGLRWRSPVGPVRVDLARALDGDGGWQLHLRVGPDL